VEGRDSPLKEEKRRLEKGRGKGLNEERGVESVVGETKKGTRRGGPARRKGVHRETRKINEGRGGKKRGGLAAWIERS